MESNLPESYSQVNFILLRMANPTSMEVPFVRGTLIGVRLWDVG